MNSGTNSRTDPRIDPLTGDYDGSVVDDLQNAVYLRITTPRGSYWADPTLGSDLHLLQREKELPRVKLLADQYIRQALQPLLDAKRADRIEVEADDPAHNQMLLRCNVYQSGVLVAHFAQYVVVMQS
jgi:phage gp46-like protein